MKKLLLLSFVPLLIFAEKDTNSLRYDFSVKENFSIEEKGVEASDLFHYNRNGIKMVGRCVHTDEKGGIIEVETYHKKDDKEVLFRKNSYTFDWGEDVVIHGTGHGVENPDEKTEIVIKLLAIRKILSEKEAKAAT